MKIVRDRGWKRCAEHRHGGSKDYARLVAVARGADCLKECARPIEIDVITLFEINLGFARDNACKVKDHLRPFSDRPRADAWQCQIRRDIFNRAFPCLWSSGGYDVEQGELVDR